jgi:hypothetical protein
MSAEGSGGWEEPGVQSYEPRAPEDDALGGPGRG